MKTKNFIFGFITCLIVIIVSVIIFSKFLEAKKEKMLESENAKEIDQITYSIISIESEEINKLKLLNIKDEQISFKENVVFINFWATWCLPCIAEMPTIKKLEPDSNKEKKPIEFILVTSDSKEKVKKFEDKKHFGFEYAFYDDKTISSVFKSKSIPVTYILDFKNMLCYKIEGSTNYSSKVFKKFINSITNSSQV